MKKKNFNIICEVYFENLIFQHHVFMLNLLGLFLTEKRQQFVFKETKQNV